MPGFPRSYHCLSLILMLLWTLPSGVTQERPLRVT
mgnify:CR=1 FL=1